LKLRQHRQRVAFRSLDETPGDLADAVRIHCSANQAELKQLSRQSP
jgi:hypothetical protein